MSDAVALEIGVLFDKARKAAAGTIGSTVTDSRNFSEKISPSRNADTDKRPDPDKCCGCLVPFSHGQTRYPAVADWFPTVISSLCMGCFKDWYGSDYHCESLGLDRNGKPASRYNTKCDGCGEPLSTISNARNYYWSFCSNRCYQRVYRKRRRGHDSVVAWKVGSRPKCEVCKKATEQSRKDAKYCSGKCRQLAYRRRQSV
jgi:endogenous inhibitor of DNA gyrase (YacG/DUF329 family)